MLKLKKQNNNNIRTISLPRNKSISLSIGKNNSNLSYSWEYYSNKAFKKGWRTDFSLNEASKFNITGIKTFALTIKAKTSGPFVSKIGDSLQIRCIATDKNGNIKECKEYLIVVSAPSNSIGEIM